MYDEESVSGMSMAFGTVVRAVIAFVAAFFLYVVIFRLSRLPQFGGLDQGGHSLVFFMLLMVTIAGLMLILFQEHWGPATRGFAIMLSVVLVGITYGQLFGYLHFDPMAPLDVMVRDHIVHLNR